MSTLNKEEIYIRKFLGMKKPFIHFLRGLFSSVESPTRNNVIETSWLLELLQPIFLNKIIETKSETQFSLSFPVKF